MATASTEPRISLHPHDRRVQVTIGNTLLADTTRAIELREHGYPPRQYIPREDVRMDLLTPSETVTHCPFKGDATYFSLGDEVDMAWSYEHPLESMEPIVERLAFDGEKKEVRVNECPDTTQSGHAGKDSKHGHWGYVGFAMIGVIH